MLQNMPSVERDVAHLTHVRTSKDGTTKLLLKLVDGLEVETVIIPWDDRKSSTLCVSSQVGCRQACAFCATGRMGILRSLSRDEILAQVYWANKVCRIDQIHPVMFSRGWASPGTM
jgi:23S rRNA (adenine2503-C2)-methyltransferase